MSNSQITSELGSGETDVCEFKSSFNAAVIESLVAFANTVGGTVLVGVEDNGLPVGTLNIGNETVANWVNEIKTKTQPALVPDVSVEEIQGEPVVRLSVPEYPVKPLSVRGRYYKRVGNSNHQMSLNEIANLHLQTINLSWDFYADETHGIEDLSLGKVNHFIALANALRANEILDDPLTVLRKYELIRGERITFGCFLLFCQEASLVSTIEAGRFDSETIIRDSITIKADLFSEVDMCVAFIQKHISKRYVITGKPQRDEVWEYPMEAVREIVINMIVHRDYQATADSTIKIHSDRIELFNPGALPDGMTIEDIVHGSSPSRPRNRLVASIFKESGVIEKYGSGIKRVHQVLADNGAPAPVFESMAGIFKVTIFPISKNDGGGQKSSQKSSQKSGQKLLTGIRGQLVEMLLENPSVTRRELSIGLNIAESAIEKHIAILKNAGIIVRKGGRKAGYWEVSLSSTQ